jgi:hypothetical protein
MQNRRTSFIYHGDKKSAGEKLGENSEWVEISLGRSVGAHTVKAPLYLSPDGTYLYSYYLQPVHNPAKISFID